VALTKVLLDVVEKQAARRVTSGSLNPSQIERLGRSLMQVRKRFQQMCETLGLSPSELELPLSQQTLNATDAAKPLLQISNPSSLGPAFSSSVGLTTDAIVNVIDRLIEKRTTIAGDITISLAGVELVVLHLLATLEPIGLAKSLPRSGQSYREAKSSRGIGEMLQSE
jgi:hypothetical protein